VAPSGPAGGRPSGPAYRSRPRPRWGRIFLVLGGFLMILALVASGVGYLYYNSLSNEIDRTDPFAGITGARPAKAVDGAVNILLLGSDSRDPDNGSQSGEWRTDTMIIAHIPSTHDKVYLVSIPRDLYIHIPQSPTNPKLGNTKAKINAAFAWGGLPLTVQALEEYSGLRMDHVMLIDFGGFKQVVDALGGIDMPIEQDIKSIHPPYRQFKKGNSHLDGAAALDYVRQRYQFAEGDFARMRHQQQFMRAVLDKAASTGTMSNPVKLNGFLRSTAKAATVDNDFSLIDMAFQFRGIRGEDLVFKVAPNAGPGRTRGGEDVIMPDTAKGPSFYDALKNDKAAEWFAQNSAPTGR
jgi:LCP family protein required for cell wall assembly